PRVQFLARRRSCGHVRTRQDDLGRLHLGARGRPVDAVVLRIFVTLSHTTGIVLVAVLAALGSAWLLPQRVEAYLGVGTGLLVIGIGLWMLRAQLSLAATERAGGHAHDDAHAHSVADHTHDHVHAHDHGVTTDKTCSTEDKRGHHGVFRSARRR